MAFYPGNSNGQASAANSQPVSCPSPRIWSPPSSPPWGLVAEQGRLVGGSDGANLRAVLVDASGRPIVTGAGAAGAALAGNPVPVRERRRERADHPDRRLWRQIVTGAGAAGAALAGNPVPIAGSDGSNARIVLTDASGRLLLGDGSGSLVSATHPIFVELSDGSAGYAAPRRRSFPPRSVRRRRQQPSSSCPRTRPRPAGLARDQRGRHQVGGRCRTLARALQHTAARFTRRSTTSPRGPE